ncbi:MAG: hypothetical protein SGPRY_004560, partial [Prymnesium sp.]
SWKVAVVQETEVEVVISMAAEERASAEAGLEKEAQKKRAEVEKIPRVVAVKASGVEVGFEKVAEVEIVMLRAGGERASVACVVLEKVAVVQETEVEVVILRAED